MTPTFSDFFKSFYYSNTYVKPVDLSEKGLSKHLLINENSATAKIAQEIISKPEVQNVLSEPLNYDLDEAVPARNAIPLKNGFKLLSVKQKITTGERVPYYNVTEHKDLDGWIIKSGAIRAPKEQFLIGPMNDRNEMANRIQKVAKSAKIDVVIPNKKLVAYANSDAAIEPNRKYCVLCEKIDILSVEDTVKTIKNMNGEEQKELAKFKHP